MKLATSRFAAQCGKELRGGSTLFSEAVASSQESAMTILGIYLAARGIVPATDFGQPQPQS